MTIYHLATGPESAKPVLFLHGFMGCGDDWLPFAEALPACRCLLPDLPGHGRTSLPHDHNLDSLAKDLLDLIPEDQQLHLVGYSMGGRVALTMLRLFPKRIADAFIISASPGIAADDARTARAEGDEQLACRLQREPFEDFLDDWYRLPLFCGLRRHPPAFKAMLARRRRNDPRKLAGALRFYSQGRMTPCWEALSETRASIHFEAGEDDPKYRQIALALQRDRPDAEVCVVPYCSHAVLTEDFDGVQTRLKAWLDRPHAERSDRPGASTKVQPSVNQRV